MGKTKVSDEQILAAIEGGIKTQSEIARQFGLTLTATRRRVRRLIRDGHVRAEQNPLNGRGLGLTVVREAKC